jgi:hypothetical protein
MREWGPGEASVVNVKEKKGKSKHNWAAGIGWAADHLNPGQMRAFEAEVSLNQRHQKKAPTSDAKA